MRRFGTAREIADLALFLASDSARYITGQVINVDGGMLMQCFIKFKERLKWKKELHWKKLLIW